ncbi:MAG: GGDEF domain-containing protein [Acidobacteriota bacterium]
MTTLTGRVLQILRRPILLSTSSAGSELPSEPLASSDDTAAVRTLTGVLRFYGEQAIAVEGLDARQSAEQFRGWAEHVRAGTRAPGTASAAPDGARDWDALYSAFARHRADEKSKVEASAAGLRDTLFSVIQRLGRSVGDGRTTNASIQTQIGRLRRTASGASVDTLRREVLSTIDAIGLALQESRARQEQMLATLGAELKVLRDELHQARTKMETDGLTRVYNRAALDGHLSRICSIAGLSGDPACLLMVDVDHFKTINDTYGHPAGDEVLRRLADTVVRTFPRRSDFVARYGGEEFAVVLPQEGLETARALGARLLVNTRNTCIQFGSATLHITISIGVAALHPGEDATSWVARADQALYRAKQEGRDRLVEG